MIRVENVGKQYLHMSIRGEKIPKWVLRNVTFSVGTGEVVGIVGKNGCGKTTLLRVISGITLPDEGRVFISGKVTPLMSLGVGFNMELNGLENIYFSCAILGMTRKEINEKIDDIIRFSELEEFMEVPLKKYSTGMFSRLAFSIATSVSAENLLIDEALSVGDASFQSKCKNKIKEITSSEGRSVIFVSHDMDTVKTICNKCIWLKEGKIFQCGEPKSVVDNYLREILGEG